MTAYIKPDDAKMCPRCNKYICLVFTKGGASECTEIGCAKCTCERDPCECVLPIELQDRVGYAVYSLVKDLKLTLEVVKAQAFEEEVMHKLRENELEKRCDEYTSLNQDLIDDIKYLAKYIWDRHKLDALQRVVDTVVKKYI